MTDVFNADFRIVADYVVILGNDPVCIGDDPKNAPTIKEWTAKFGTGGREEFGEAVLTFNVSQLTASKANVPVFINGVKVGEIRRYFGAETAQERAWDYWYSQTITFPSTVLNPTTPDKNEIRIPCSDIDEKLAESDDDKLDDFFLKDVVCWFHQRSGSVVNP
jgi:hypothetical protein